MLPKALEDVSGLGGCAGWEVLWVKEVVKECGELDDDEVWLRGERAGDGEGQEADALYVVQVVGGIVVGVVSLCEVLSGDEDGRFAGRK